MTRATIMTTVAVLYAFIAGAMAGSLATQETLRDYIGDRSNTLLLVFIGPCALIALWAAYHGARKGK